MGAKQPYYIKLLKNILEVRQENNKSYSLRSFARSLEIDASHLSKILSRKVIPSIKLADQVLARINLEQQEHKLFVESLADEIRCHSIERLSTNLTDCDD